MGTSIEEVPTQTDSNRKKSAAVRHGAFATLHMAQPLGHGQKSWIGECGQHGQWWSFSSPEARNSAFEPLRTGISAKFT